jgi:hypothetical protein
VLPSRHVCLRQRPSNFGKASSQKSSTPRPPRQARRARSATMHARPCRRRNPPSNPLRLRRSGDPHRRRRLEELTRAVRQLALLGEGGEASTRLSSGRR